MAESLKAKLARIAEDYAAEPNADARLQKQIDLLADAITQQAKPKAKRARE